MTAVQDILRVTQRWRQRATIRVECARCGRAFMVTRADRRRRYCSQHCASRLHPAVPSPEKIAERCAEIQATWTASERLARLRVDLRPIACVIPGTANRPGVTNDRDGLARLMAWASRQALPDEGKRTDPCPIRGGPRR